MIRKVSVEDFVKGYLRACREGKTREEFAAEIGLKSLTVYHRAYEIRKSLKGRGVEFPTMLIGQRKSLIDIVMKAVAEENGEAKPPRKERKRHATESAVKPKVEVEEPAADDDSDALARLFG